jgi:hypothetical protein
MDNLTTSLRQLLTASACNIFYVYYMWKPCQLTFLRSNCCSIWSAEMKCKLQLQLCFILKYSSKCNVRAVELCYGVSTLTLRILFFSDITLYSGINISWRPIIMSGAVTHDTPRTIENTKSWKWLRINYTLAYVNAKVVPDRAVETYWRVALHSPNAFTSAVMVRLPSALAPGKQPSAYIKQHAGGTKS